MAVQAGLAAYAHWVDALPDDAETTWHARSLLAFYRGRVEAWDEAAAPVQSADLPPLRRVQLGVALARAARYNEDWDRAGKWLAQASDALGKVPTPQRTFDLAMDYFFEAAALHKLTDARQPYGVGMRFVNAEEDLQARFEKLRRLLDLVLLTNDDTNYPAVAQALLGATQAWDRKLPGVYAPSRADEALQEYLGSMIDRGYFAPAKQLAETGLHDESLKGRVVTSALLASAATESEESITTFLGRFPTEAESLVALLGRNDGLDGIVVRLIRAGRGELATRFLIKARDRDLGVRDRSGQVFLPLNFGRAMNAAATGHFRAGRRDEAVGLGALFRNEHLHEDLVGFVGLIGRQGETAAARALLASLPADYEPKSMVEDVLVDMQAEFAMACAASGDRDRATTWAERVKDLPPGVNAFAAIALEDAVARENERAAGALERARAAKPAGDLLTEVEKPIFVPCLVMLGHYKDAWGIVAEKYNTDIRPLTAECVRTLIARERLADAIAWIRHARPGDELAAWQAFFRVTLPDPRIPLVRPQPQDAGRGTEGG